jgi:ribulose-phosphate 3-epimerase
MMSSVLVAPSLLACDFGRVRSEVERCLEAGADLLHLDLMDGHFVPNLSFGFPIIESLARDFPELRLDVHLMVSNPGDYVERLAELGAFQITAHWEACDHLHRVLSLIRSRGIRAGLAFNPHTPVEGARWVADLVDCYLIMTVNPGFGGQSFLHSQLPKIRSVRAIADAQARDVSVSVDGGVDGKTGPLCVAAGADLLVAGSYLFGATDMAARIDGLRASGA